MEQLAIVIPAYKHNYLRNTLDSLVAQTCQDFIVYIGDDCSPYNLKSIVLDYKKLLNIEYCRFDVNLGGIDLVAQWERCISLTKDENWIWLFSDDDVIGEKCVELFYNEINNPNNINDLLHFNIKIIDNNNSIIKSPQLYPKYLSNIDYYKYKSSGKLDSFVVEFIFSRKIYNIVKGFENFDLAWGSDVATWVKMSKHNGIKTISGDYVYWRSSTINITPNKDAKMVLRKLETDIVFLAWINKFFKNKSILLYNYYVFLRLSVYYSQIIDIHQYHLLLNKALEYQIISVLYKTILKVFYPTFPVLRKLKHLIYDYKK